MMTFEDSDRSNYEMEMEYENDKDESDSSEDSTPNSTMGPWSLALCGTDVGLGFDFVPALT
jgi:hypothetical protein